MSAVRKYEEIIEPNPITKFLNAINPIASLGKVAGKNFHENSLTISLILIFSLLVAILTTVMYIELDKKDGHVKEKHLIVAAFVISWFVFTNFFFLLFELTRLFNILLFIALITLIATATTDLDQSEIPAELGISSIALATIPLLILTYYYFVSEGDEVVQLKTLEREKREAEERKKAFNDAIKEKEEAIKKKLTEDVTSETGIRQKIGQAYIDALIKKAEKDIAGGEKKPPKDSANKAKTGEKKDEEKK